MVTTCNVHQVKCAYSPEKPGQTTQEIYILKIASIKTKLIKEHKQKKSDNGNEKWSINNWHEMSQQNELKWCHQVKS